MSNTGHPAWQLAYLVGNKPPAFGIALEAGIYSVTYGEPECLLFCKNLGDDRLILKALRDAADKNGPVLFCTDFLITDRGSYPEYFLPSLAVSGWRPGRVRDEIIENMARMWPGRRLYTYRTPDHEQIYVDVIADYSRDRADWVRVIDALEYGGMAHSPWLKYVRTSHRSLIDWTRNPKLKDWITL
jgi:hypothetical protein